METVDHQKSAPSGVSTKRVRPVITMVVARPMSEVGFRGDHMATSSQSAACSSDSFRHCTNQTDAALHGKPALPARPRAGRNPVTTETQSSRALPSAPPMKPRPTSMVLPSQSYARPLRPQPLPPDRLGGPLEDQCEEENIVNDLLERTSSLSPRPSFPRPTIISPTHNASNTATDHACGEMSLSDQCHQDTPRGSHSTVTRPTIIGQPRHQSGSLDRTQASHSGSRDGQVSSSVTCSTNDNNNDVSKKTQIRVTPFAKPEVAPKPHLAPKPGLRGVRPSNNAAGQESKQQLWPALTASSVEKATTPIVEKGTKQSFNVIQKHTEKSVQQSIMTNIIKPHLGSSKFVQKATKPLVDKATKQMYASAEKKTEASVNKAIVSTVVGQQAEPSQTVQRTTRGLSSKSQALPTTFKDTKLTASSVERATAPVVEKGTKQSFDVIQKHTEKSVQKSIMTNIVKPHLGSSKFVQKATTPLVDKATKQMYASAEKKTEASINKAIVTTVVGQQAEPSQTVQRTKRVLSVNTQALPSTFKDTKLTASSVERATAPVVEKGTKQSFDVIQKHTEKSVQKSIMTNVVKPHLGSSKFVQKATTPLVDKATKQMYASAEKKTEASINKAIVSTVVGHQEPTESDETPRAYNNQARTSMTSAVSKSALSNNRLEPSALLHRSGISTEASTKLVGDVAQKHDTHGNQSKRFQTPRIIRVSATQKGVEKSHSAATSVQRDDTTSREATNLTASSSAGRSMVNLAGVGSGKTAAASEAPVARRRSIGNIRTKLSARPKSMNFDLLTTKRRDECRDFGRTQPSVVAQRTASVKKRHAPPRPSAGPMRLSSKSFSHPSRPGTGGDRHTQSSNTRLSVWSNKQEHRTPTTGQDVPHCIALFDYDASQPDELSFQTGDTVTLLRKVDDQWFCGRVGGKEGIFPSSFIDVLVPIPSEGEITDTGDYTDSREGTTWPTPSHPTPEYIPGEEWLVNREQDGDNCAVLGHKVAALFTFVGEPGELSFVAGAAICVHGKLTSDWLYGELAGECGRFPASFVSVSIEMLPQLDPTHVTLTGDKNKEHTDAALGMKDEDFHLPSGGDRNGNGFETAGTLIQESTYCIAVHPFNGGSLEDLTFAAGDRIKVLARLNSDWLRGSLNGQEGIFPLAYVDLPTTNEGPSSDVTSRLADLGVSRSVDTNITSARTERAGASTQDTASTTHAADAYPEDTGSYPEGSGSYPEGSGVYPEGSGSTVLALFDYTGNTESDLSFKAGEEIQDIEHINDDWMKGRIAHRTGMFPSNYVGSMRK